MSTPSLPSAPSPLVGRDRELFVLRQHLGDAFAGRGSLVLIGGEAGIGKTALIETLCREGEAQGSLVLVGRCYDLTETPPYGPWVELLGRFRPADGFPTIPSAFATRGTIGETTSQGALFHDVHGFLAALAAQRPLLCLLDDCHWADPASLDLLRFLAQSVAAVPMVLMVTYRSDELTRRHPLSILIPTLVRESRATRLDLRRLTDANIGALVTARYPLPEADAARLVAMLDARSEGNPFFLSELLRTLEEEGALHATDDEWQLDDLTQVPVPLLLRQVIDARVARLGEGASDLLGIAAVIGQEVPLALWARVAGTNEEALLGTIERAVETHLLTETPDGTRVQFTHALIREAQYEGMLATRRRVLHRHVGEALATTRNPDPNAVAYHFQHAADARAAEWLVLAGRQAQRAYAWLTAADRYEAATAMMEASDAPVSERGWLRYQLAMLRRLADPRRSIASFDEARQLAHAGSDRVLAAHAVFGRALLHCFVGELAGGIAEFAESITMLEALPALVGAQHTRLAEIGISADLNDYRGTYALWLGIAGRFAEAHALAARVLAAPPPASGAHGLFGAAYGDAIGALRETAIVLGRPDEARQASIQYGEMMQDLGHDFVAYINWVTLVRNVLLPYFADRVAERATFSAKADAAWTRATDLVGADDQTRQLDRIATLVLQGRWHEARYLTRLLPPNGNLYNQCDMGRLARWMGETTRAWQIVQRTLPAGSETPPGSVRFLIARELQLLAAALALDAGDVTTARIWLEAHDRWQRWSGAVLGESEGQAVWAQYHRKTGDRERAQTHAECALAHATAPRQPLALLAAHRLLGELDTDAGRYEEATRHLDDALTLADACHAPYERALALLAMAELRAATREIEAAHTLLDEVRTLCTPLDARPALARTDALAAQFATPSAASPPYPNGLSAREVDVLRLIATGRNNGEIADALFLSVRTVERHITNLYAKIAARGRADATAYALRHRI